MPAPRQTPHETLKLLQSRAAEMRACSTFLERALWEALSGSKLGVAFRRQVVIAPFIADFYCASRRLVVEVDGGYHSERAAADARRDTKLRRRGCRVLRLPEELVLRDMAEAVRRIREALGLR